MRFYDKNSWKKKIDPAFDKPIKIYSKCLTVLEQLTDFWQDAFQDKFIEIISKDPNLLPDYNKDFKREMLQLVENVGLVNKHQREVILGTVTAIDVHNGLLSGLQKDGSRITISQSPMVPRITSHMHSLIKLAEKLPEEESKQYYVNKINVFTKGISAKHIIPFQKDLISILLSLFTQLIFNEIDKINDKCTLKEDAEHLKNPIVISTMMGFLNSTVSQLSHKKDIPGLLNKVDKGDEKSLFKAITIDKTLVDYEPIKNRIIQAQVSGDKEFLTKLGKAIVKSPLECVGKYGKTYAVLELFWNTELYKLNNQELYFFLDSCSLEIPSSQEAFDRFLLRHIKKTK